MTRRWTELWLLLCADIPLACGLLAIGVGLFTGQAAEVRVAFGLLAVLWGALLHFFVWLFTRHP
jgi:hypothetical protein